MNLVPSHPASTNESSLSLEAALKDGQSHGPSPNAIPGMVCVPRLELSKFFSEFGAMPTGYFQYCR